MVSGSALNLTSSLWAMLANEIAALNRNKLNLSNMLVQKMRSENKERNYSTDSLDWFGAFARRQFELRKIDNDMLALWLFFFNFCSDNQFNFFRNAIGNYNKRSRVLSASGQSVKLHSNFSRSTRFDLLSRKM